MVDSRWISQVVAYTLNGSRKATKYVTPTLTVKASRRHKPNRRTRYAEVLLTIGTPNYAERAFIRLAKKAGERFPIKKVQLRGW